MKTLSCDICETTFSAEDFDGWFKQMVGHYIVEHAEVMEAAKDKSKEEGEEWMAAAKQRFEDA
ncbi:MAG: hypothetical protein COA45_05390 [Zetaproteobacteria bacterium]|nr:MAG: hypothetical protein COA45_05390 [Zetaproteobacteria bacterium]